ncbi:ATP-binding protein [Fructilactobacillus myrtifloralis]|uniref:ATP-binding protein n=1 Tax=Fructilactobacillus myrtifloralis TaxID=2940301 RepID=A0ABY5BM18_9LACO|nr:ATP-binding protein [Fructilactobacillus myrtifloralis]USS84559.1 ATP-binding protein [Fructilactobacillus myrtifloralis]
MAKVDRSGERKVSPLKIKPQANTPKLVFPVEKPQRDLQNLIVADEVATQIKSLLSKIENYDLLYNQFGLREIDSTGGRTVINLYGLPGTGKSFAAEAIAKALGKQIIKVNYAEIESKYVGETPKNIKLLFKEAKDQDAVLIFDEADSILGRRLDSVTKSTDQAVNLTKSVMLLELDNFSGIAIFTTNFGKNYDPAFLRRIIGNIEFPLPAKAARGKILAKLIPAKLPVDLTPADLDQILEHTEGFAGGDLLNVVVYASSHAVERDGAKCKVGLADFDDAIGLIKKAKHELAQ